MTAKVISLASVRAARSQALADEMQDAALRHVVSEARDLAAWHGRNEFDAMARAAWLASLVPAHLVLVFVLAWLRDDPCPFMREPDDWQPWHDVAARIDR